MNFSVVGNQSFHSAEFTLAPSKNAALPILIACLLIEGDSCIENAPLEMLDVVATCRMLEDYGLFLSYSSKSQGLILTNKGIRRPNLILEYGTRYESLLLGAMLPLFGEARIMRPGGCKITQGMRALDIHLDGFTRFGCHVEESNGDVSVRMERHIEGNYRLRFPSVGATENLLLFCSRVPGQRRLSNCAKEPEIQNLIDFLNQSGAEVRSTSPGECTIIGKPKLRASKPFRIIPDRIELATYCVLAALTRQRAVIHGVRPYSLRTPKKALGNAGLPMFLHGNTLVVCGDEVTRLRAFQLRTGPYPQFPSDMQPLLAPIALQAEGISEIIEDVFDNRFTHVPELRKLGAQIEVAGKTARFTGSAVLCGTSLKCHDIRGGMACLLATTIASGESKILEAHHIQRGYEKVIEKFASFGIRIESQEC